MIRVFLVENEHLVREGLRALLALEPEVKVVGEAAGGREAIEAVPRAQVNVLLLDLRMPEVSGLQVLEELGRQKALPPTLILTTFDQTWDLVESVRRGARGYLRKDVTLEQLIQAIRRLAAGETFFHPGLTERLLQSGPVGGEVPELQEALTPREVEVIRLLAGGMSNREIAEILGAAEGTVKHHVSNVLSKLGARDRTQAVLFAIERGLFARTDPKVPGGG
jgi:DNA-binding NarL/FixJ family response regulator